MSNIHTFCYVNTIWRLLGGRDQLIDVTFIYTFYKMLPNVVSRLFAVLSCTLVDILVMTGYFVQLETVPKTSLGLRSTQTKLYTNYSMECRQCTVHTDYGIHKLQCILIQPTL